MYLKKFEYFILDSSVAGTLLLIALAIRIEAVNAGFDQFSSNIIFISVFIISTGLYISMQIALYEIIIYLCHHSKSLSIHEHLNDSVIEPEQAFMEYEKLRSNTIIEQKRTNDKKLELVHIYIHQTMAAYTSQENLQRLCAYISDLIRKSNGNHSTQSPADVQAWRNFWSCEKGTFLADSRKCSLARFRRKEKALAHWDF